VSGSKSSPSVTLVTDAWTRRHADVAGSPLEGRIRVTRVDWEASMDEAERAALLDAALEGAGALLFAPWLFGRLLRFDEDRWGHRRHVRQSVRRLARRRRGRSAGVVVIDTSRSMTPTVAEYALAMTLNLLRDLPAAIELVRGGGWKSVSWDQPEFVYGDLTGRRVGLAGYGSINRRYAELLAPFRCTVLACDPFVPDAELRDAGIEPVGSLTDLAARSEVLVVGIPPTPATQRIISTEVIDALPRGAHIVVVTRMAVVDQEALWRRAEAGEIRAAVDVFEPEPPPADASFRTSRFVLPTPHVAGDTTYCHRRCFTAACADVLAVLAGEAPRYRVTQHDDQIYRGMPV
jgi:phosphoglycerate dehydrogenase-like enzyme